MVVAIVLAFFSLLLRRSIASPLLTPLPSTSFSPNPLHHNHARTIPNIDHPNIVSHPTSAIGLTQSYPVCDSTALGVPTLWTDCVHAYNQMEEEDTARVTGYVGNSENMEFYNNMETASMDYLGIPRLYWFGGCVIEISAATMQQGQYGMIVGSDIAHKNAIKVTAAGILEICVRRSQGGGYDMAGQFLHLHIRVLAVENLDPQALYAINLAKTQGYSNANIHFASNSPEPQTLTDTPEQEERQGDFEPGMGLPPVRLPVTACLREGEMRCGVGVECVVEGGGSGNGRGGSGKGGVMQVLWGLVVEVGFCDWVETGSGLLARASEVGW